MDTLEAMKVFLRVADAGGFAVAARQMDLTPASVTRAVQSLEERVGMRLLQRTTRSVRLTQTGERYLETVRRMLEEIEEIEDALRHERSSEVSGTLRLSMPVALGTRHLVPLLAQFKQRHPRLRMDLDFSDGPVDLVEQGFDAAIRVSTKLADSSLSARRIGGSPVVISASPAYLQRHGAPVTLDDLQRHHCLHYAHQEAARNGVSEPQIRANNGEALKGLAVAGLGLIQTPAFLVADELADGRLLRVLPRLDLGEYVVSVVFAERSLMPLRLRCLIDHLAGRLGDLGAAARLGPARGLRAVPMPLPMAA
jgi:DNA-binding transcriptional LysR family regulator